MDVNLVNAELFLAEPTFHHQKLGSSLVEMVGIDVLYEIPAVCENTSTDETGVRHIISKSLVAANRKGKSCFAFNGIFIRL